MTKKLNRKDLWKIFRRQMLIRSCLNFERQQNAGFTAAMTPVVDKFYETEEDKKAAYERHMQLFLTQPMISALPVGIAAAMEERYANQRDIDPSSINAVKTALMGPLAALGDSLINGTARPILAAIAVTFALEGSIIGPLMFLVGMILITMGVRYLGVFKGYEKGVSIVDDLQQSGLIHKLTELASVAAFVIVGGFIPAVVAIALNITVSSGDSAISIQEQLDGLVPGVLPLLLTLLMYYLISKRKMNPVLLMFALMFFGVIGVYVGIF